MMLKITAGKPKKRKIWSCDSPQIFSGWVMMFVIGKKRVATRFYCGVVPTIWIKQHKERPNFWNWHVGSLEFGKLLDWLGEYERCLITQRERKTITGEAGLAPRVILVTSIIADSKYCQTVWPKMLQMSLWRKTMSGFERFFRKDAGT